MTKKEFAQIVLGIKAAYPNATVLEEDTAKDLWYLALGDLDYPVVHNAVMEHICTQKWPPSIAEIREKCTEQLFDIPDWGEAWESVLRAISRYGYMQEIEALSSLDDLTRIAVKRIGFRNICMSENIVADRANFRNIYEGMLKEEKKLTQLPGFVREAKERMLKDNTPIIPKIDAVAETNLEIKEGSRSMSKQVEELLRELRHSMGVKYRYSENRKS